jgi:serine/threonine protein kinase
VIHDDIKLENILMKSVDRDDEYNRLKICDFGLAQKVDPYTHHIKMDVQCGTFGYMAPEI